MSDLLMELKKLDKLIKEHTVFSKPIFDSMFKHDEILHFDLYAISILNRSCSLTSGIKVLIQNKNFISAAAILRLQLDNIIRFYALIISEKPVKFVESFFKGIPINKMKDRNNKKLTDKYLREQVAIAVPWINGAYEKASGYIHFSARHIFNAMCKDTSRNETEEKIPIKLKISPTDEFIGENNYREIITTFLHSTDALSGLIPLYIRFVDSITNREKEKKE